MSKTDLNLVLRETMHRCANDLQLVIGFLRAQGARASNDDVRQALVDAADRVAIIGLARASHYRERRPSLQTALRRVCDALHSLAEPRAITVSLECEQDYAVLSESQVTALALAVNELATNAIKHAFAAGIGGSVTVSVREIERKALSIIVDDDGIPFAPAPSADHQGIGWELVAGLVASADGLLIRPRDGAKSFEIRLPLPDSDS